MYSMTVVVMLSSSWPQCWATVDDGFRLHQTNNVIFPIICFRIWLLMLLRREHRMVWACTVPVVDGVVVVVVDGVTPWRGKYRCYTSSRWCRPVADDVAMMLRRARITSAVNSCRHDVEHDDAALVADVFTSCRCNHCRCCCRWLQSKME